MQPMKSFLWFDNEAAEAANFYTSLFDDGKIVNINHYGEGMPKSAGTVMTVVFQINGMEFIALNGGPEFKFNPSVSFVVPCDTQAEIDKLWNALASNGGKPVQCGWLTDRFGLSWQIVPAKMSEYAKSSAAMQALMGMVKIDIDTLEKAAKGQ